MNCSKFFRDLLAAATMALLTFASGPQAAARDTNDNSSAEPAKHKFFEFEGGTPFDFIKALDQHFRTRLIQILTLPETLRNASVPKLRVAAKEPREVLSVYNHLDDPELGQWKYVPDTGLTTGSTNLGVLALVPDKSVAAASIQRNQTRVAAIAIGDIGPEKWDNLTLTIRNAVELGQKKGLGSYDGEFYIQRDSKILIAAGPERFIETVASVISAFKENGQLAARPVTGQK